VTRRSRKLEQAEQARVAEEAFSVVRHDVRNKLAAARQAATYLETKSRRGARWDEDPRFEKFFAMIQEQLEIAEKMMTEHPAFHRIYEPEPKPVSAAAILDTAVTEAALGAGVTVARGAVEDAQLVVDPAELALAVRCLIENAAEANAGRGAVHVSGRSSPAGYVFVVADEGPGLSEERFRVLMRPFETTHPDARGIGLSIARRVALRYGGTLRLSESAAGTTVHLVVDPGEGGAR
jgi:signal transduction histidine kinase